ncbi:MAG: hypothetical protein N4A45_12615 [Flavobacteriales bacterium]|jgi:hypothetical protein|nr:hypothetical protein [Flavobacteriales bacterium]
MKNNLLLFFSIFFISFSHGQDKRYDFINQKLESDSLLESILQLKPINLDTSEVLEHLLFELFMSIKEKNNDKWIDLHKQLHKSNIKNQVIHNNSIKRFKRRHLHKNQIKNNLFRKSKFGTLYLSFPILFKIKNQEYAYIEISIINAPLFGQGYYEIYKKTQGKWKMITQRMTWMS